MGGIVTPWNAKIVEEEVDRAINSKRPPVPYRPGKYATYNGFSSEQRSLGQWKINIAIALGLIPPATGCSVCGRTSGAFQYHGEDYSRPLLVAPICKSCHGYLHRRFKSSNCAETWRKMVKQYGDGTKWFDHLAASPSEPPYGNNIS